MNDRPAAAIASASVVPVTVPGVDTIPGLAAVRMVGAPQNDVAVVQARRDALPAGRFALLRYLTAEGPRQVLVRVSEVTPRPRMEDRVSLGVLSPPSPAAARQTDRYPVGLVRQFRALVVGPGVQEHISGVVVNASVGGALIDTSAPLAIGDRLSIEDAEAEVVRRDPLHPRLWGVRFLQEDRAVDAFGALLAAMNEHARGQRLRPRPRARKRS